MRSSLLVLLLFMATTNAEKPQGVVTGDLSELISEKAEADEKPKSPCVCSEGVCSCCTGFILGQFGFGIQQRGCVNVTYDPDEFAFTTVFTINDRVLYKNSLSGKNPAPVCVPVPRVSNLKLCVVFSNVYFAGRNLHVCVSMQAQWAGSSLFQMSLDCIRIGANGVAVVKPEDGGGLPSGISIPQAEDQDDYDDDDDDDDDDAVLT